MTIIPIAQDETSLLFTINEGYIRSSPIPTVYLKPVLWGCRRNRGDLCRPYERDFFHQRHVERCYRYLNSALLTRRVYGLVRRQAQTIL